MSYSIQGSDFKVDQHVPVLSQQQPDKVSMESRLRWWLRRLMNPCRLGSNGELEGRALKNKDPEEQDLKNTPHAPVLTIVQSHCTQSLPLSSIDANL